MAWHLIGAKPLIKTSVTSFQNVWVDVFTGENESEWNIDDEFTLSNIIFL